MNFVFIRIFTLSLVFLTFSCSEGNDGIDGVDGIDGQKAGLEYLVFAGDITDEEAAAIIAEDFGANTHAILVTNTTNLSTLTFPDVTTLTELTITENIQLESIVLPNLESVVGDVFITANDALRTINFENLTQVRDYSLTYNNALTSVRMDQLTIVDNFSSQYNPVLENIGLPALIEVTEEIEISDSKNLSNVEISAVETIGDLRMEDNEDLSTLDLPNLTDIRLIRILNNPSMETINAPSLITNVADHIYGSISIGRNSNLSAINFDSLKEVRELSITANDNLTTMNIDALETSVEELYFVGNDKLSTLAFPKLTTCGGLTIRQNVALTTLSFPILTSIEPISVFVSTQIEDNGLITSIDFPNLETFVGRDFSIEEDNLETVNLENLVTVSDLNISARESIISVNLSSINEFNRLYLSVLTTEDVDSILETLVNINPTLTEKTILIYGETVSDQANTNAETLSNNGNTVQVR